MKQQKLQAVLMQPREPLCRRLSSRGRLSTRPRPQLANGRREAKTQVYLTESPDSMNSFSQTENCAGGLPYPSTL